MADYTYTVEDVQKNPDTKKEESGETSTALAPIFSLEEARHHLMLECEREHAKHGAEELALDKELGLQKQAEFTSQEILQKDIDELTSSRDYHEVDSHILGKLFGLGALQRMCFWHNVKEAFKEFFGKTRWLFLSTAITGLVGYSTIEYFSWMNAHVAALGPYHWILGALFGLGTVASIVCTIGIFAAGMKFEFDFIRVELDSKTLQETGVRIPFGAKLKTAEAKRTDIFTDFRLVHPSFKVKVQRTGWEPIRVSFPTDPAIVGETDDGRQFLIVYWDIEKDRARVINDFKKYRRQKLQKI